MELVLATVAIIVAISTMASTIYLYIRVFTLESRFKTAVDEIKSKIGSIIRDINIINRIEYDVDVQQQEQINHMSKQSLTKK